MIFLDRPENFSPRFEIVSAYITAQDKMLLLHRQNHKPQGGTWGEPAGKIDLGESKHTAIQREIQEETGLVVPEKDISFFKSIFVRFPEYDFVYHMFGIQFDTQPEVQINEEEHQNFVWVTPQESLNMNLITDNEPTIKLFFGI